ncbi:hypothetical protein OF377_02945 [Ureaplasma sp. ES3154-GEN]|uniref:hypothetical protein n=1 Tax=Ureaplasma sp. ES3154-GEN TaxID=2984844 RepID=UPI0021E7F3A4|nr:hypothetical protein [Ureaplasma sp. ES3154-GEN]MCV3743817.1 hypothetical protein [Ureaplasma sp. ES3154-GEN]
MSFDAKRNLQTILYNKRRLKSKIIKAAIFSGLFTIISSASIVLSVTKKNELYIEETISLIKEYNNTDWTAYIGLTVDQEANFQTTKSGYNYKRITSFNDYLQLNNHWVSYDADPKQHLGLIRKLTTGKFNAQFFENYDLLVISYNQLFRYYLLNYYDVVDNQLNFYYLDYYELFNGNENMFNNFQIMVDQINYNHIQTVLVPVNKEIATNVVFHSIRYSNELKKFYETKMQFLNKEKSN